MPFLIVIGKSSNDNRPASIYADRAILYAIKFGASLLYHISDSYKHLTLLRYIAFRIMELNIEQFEAPNQLNAKTP